MISRESARELILFAAKRTKNKDGHLTTIARMLVEQAPRVIVQIGSGPELAVLARYASLCDNVSVVSLDHSTAAFASYVNTLGSLRRYVDAVMSEPQEGVMFQRGMFHQLAGSMMSGRVTADMIVIGEPAVPGSRAAQIVRAWRMVAPQGCMWISGIRNGDGEAWPVVTPKEKSWLAHHLEVINSDTVKGTLIAGYGSRIKHRSVNPMIDSNDGLCAPRATVLSIDSDSDSEWLSTTIASPLVCGTNVLVSCDDEKVLDRLDRFELSDMAKVFGARSLQFSTLPNYIIDGLHFANQFDAKVLISVQAGWRLDRRPRFIDAIGDALTAVVTGSVGAVDLSSRSRLTVKDAQLVPEIMPPGVLEASSGGRPIVPHGAFVANVSMASPDPIYLGWDSVGVVTPGPMVKR
jgi:hypothetical protein